MDYRIELEEHASNRIVHTSVSGLMSDKDRDRVAIETIRTMREHGVSRAIWDIREAELDYSLLGSHLVATNLAALGVSEADRIAVVYAKNQEQHEHAKLVAMNRGITALSYFRTLEEASKWLVSTT